MATDADRGVMITMQITKVSLLGVVLMLMAGCATFETTPEDVHQKLTHPLDGHLYVPAEHLQTIAATER